MRESERELRELRACIGLEAGGDLIGRLRNEKRIFLAFLLPAKGASKPTQPQVLTILTVV